MTLSGSGYFTRLGAVLFTAALLIATIMYPTAGRNAVERARMVAAAVETTPISARDCAIGEPAFSGPFAAIDDVLSVSPLGGVTAPGEVLPAPYIRINTRRADQGFKRRTTIALAPAKADIVALERKIDRNSDGGVHGFSWMVHFRSCKNIAFYYDRLDTLDDAIIARAGGVETFEEFGGPDHIAIETQIRVNKGDAIGAADGFNIGLHDLAASPAAFERPERYSANPYARAAVFDAPPSLLKAITPDTSRARCPIDYLPKDEQPLWAAKLGDSWGIRRAKGANACRTAVTDEKGAAQGVWFTDAAHNAATTKVSAVVLAADAIAPGRLIFSLHGRLTSLTPDLVGLAPFMDAEREAAVKDFLTFEQGDGRINTAFSEVRDGEVYCYEKLRTNFLGPLINGVVVLERQSGEAGPALLKIEARSDALSCIDLEEPWAFSGNETVFYR
jgi:hypothetical protein